MRIDRYETEYKDGKLNYFAVKGKERIRMPPEHSEMYTDDYLAIEKISRNMPELFDSEESDVYIPLKTAVKD